MPFRTRHSLSLCLCCHFLPVLTSGSWRNLKPNFTPSLFLSFSLSLSLSLSLFLSLSLSPSLSLLLFPSLSLCISLLLIFACFETCRYSLRYKRQFPILIAFAFKPITLGFMSPNQTICFWPEKRNKGSEKWHWITARKSDSAFTHSGAMLSSP